MASPPMNSNKANALISQQTEKIVKKMESMPPMTPQASRRGIGKMQKDFSKSGSSVTKTITISQVTEDVAEEPTKQAQTE